MDQQRREWIVDLVAGILIGGILGAIVAVNVVIYSGIEQGYEANLGEIFDFNVFLGVLTVSILALGPILGVMGARKLRRTRDGRG